MDNNYLERESAPIGPETWKLLNTVMIEAAKSQRRPEDNRYRRSVRVRAQGHTAQ